MQIRCTLSDFDLSERNMNLSELTYGSDKAQRLFSEMIQQASAQVGFDAEDLPIMVEAIPLSNQSVMLVITKVDDPEEMDTRYSRFSPAPDSFLFPGMQDIPDPGLEAPEIFSVREPAADGSDRGSASAGSPGSSPVRTRVFIFRTLDRIIEAAGALPEVPGLKDRLYKNPSDGNYYLVLWDSGSDPVSFAAVCNRLSDYGSRVRQHYAGDSYYQEHFDLILREHVLSSLRKIK